MVETHQAALELFKARRAFGKVVAVDDVSLSLAQGEFVTLLGPSGSGKTSTLRLIGGFENLDSGSISINGERIDHLPAYQRDTATIFQSGALFPHKSVAENVAYGLRMRKLPKPEIETRVRQTLDIVRLQGYEDRFPNQLSGGQKQRVALARSLAVRPAILLFDEPLSALDLSLRLQLRAEIKRLHDEFKFTAVYVTHDQGEAMAMSSRVAVMNKGRIEQIGPPTEIFQNPTSEFVYTFIGESCCLDISVSNGKMHDSAGAPLSLVLEKKSLPDGKWRLYVRPSKFSLGKSKTAANTINARVYFVEFLGDVYRYHLKTGALEFFTDHNGSAGFNAGDQVVVGWRSEDMQAFK